MRQPQKYPDLSFALDDGETPASVRRDRLAEFVKGYCARLNINDRVSTKQLVTELVAPKTRDTDELQKLLYYVLRSHRDTTLAGCRVLRAEKSRFGGEVTRSIWCKLSVSRTEAKQTAMLAYIAKQADFDPEAKAILEMPNG